MQKLKIAVIPGDGIGREVIPEGIRVLEAAGSTQGIEFQWTEFRWSCETYHRTGRMMPKDGIDRLRDFDAVYLGAVGYPGVPDHISLWGLLIPISQHALLGQPGSDNGRKLSLRHGRSISHRYSHCQFRAYTGAFRCRGRLQPVRRHPLGLGSCLHRNHRHRAFGQHQPRREVSLHVRTGARVRPRHRRPGHRQPHRHNLGRSHDDATPGLPRHPRYDLAGH